MGRLNDSDLAAWVIASCQVQGVPVKVTDIGIVRGISALLGASAPGGRPARSGGRRPVRESETPDRLHAAGVERPGSGGAGTNDGVVQDGGDDGVLTVEVEIAPSGTEGGAVAR